MDVWITLIYTYNHQQGNGNNYINIIIASVPFCDKVRKITNDRNPHAPALR
jgi:hypothetical protein